MRMKATTTNYNLEESDYYKKWIMCIGCKKEYELPPYRIKNGFGKYCSKKCAKLYGEKRTSIKIKKVCQECGKEFEIIPSREKNNEGVYCSKTCHYKSRSKTFTGENNHNWNGGSSFQPYCPKFTNEFKERVRTFFGHKCMMPGCNHVWQPGETKLAVHHVNFLKNSCCNPSIPRLFVPLCHQPCHTKTNHNRPYWEKLFTKLIVEEFNGQCYLPKEHPNL